jgi:hypothetical protein
MESCPPALQTYPKFQALNSGNRYWSWRRDLNPRPSDYKSDALPAELRQQKSRCFCIDSHTNPFFFNGTIIEVITVEFEVQGRGSSSTRRKPAVLLEMSV